MGSPATGPLSDVVRESETYTASREDRPDPENVVVAIPTLNEEASIKPCLDSLLSDPWMHDVRVVIADGGSTDKTCEMVRALQAEHPNLELIDNPNRLQSAAINAVAKTCPASDKIILVRCDAHAIYPNYYVRHVVEALIAKPDAASVVTPMDARGSGCFQAAAAWVVDTPLGSGGAAHRGGTKSHWVDHGHHAGFRLGWFRKIGGYNDSFSHNEDAEFDHRLSKAGGQIWLDANIRLDYFMRPSARALARQYWNYGRGRARTVREHNLRPRVRQLIPALNLVVQALALALLPIFPIALLPIALYLAMLVAMSCLGTAQMKSICGLLAGPALFVMHMSWGAGFLSKIVVPKEQ